MIKLSEIREKLEAMDYIVFDRNDCLEIPIYQLLTNRYTPLTISIDDDIECIEGFSETGCLFQIAPDNTNRKVMLEQMLVEIATYSYMDVLDMAREFKKLSV